MTSGVQQYLEDLGQTGFAGPFPSFLPFYSFLHSFAWRNFLKDAIFKIPDCRVWVV